ncbi:type IV secretion protein DotI [Legionella sp. MW5194]|uniref:type IVB secretion system apparatus protein IcmL/DotI n=1 Tax=Legionella sp. MW5194 TaxID=2662448 RepID=UPI00193CDB7B|nr:type IVB secretion system apparatus protein IcmL/DotI [Legionella sp. MW5194]QRN03148.1 type IV secretion protein DotI [Legionella sp. MW5194]
MPQDALMAVHVRNEYYRKGHRKVMGILLVSLGINLLLAFLLIWIVNNPPAPRYFPTSLNGRVMPLFPLNQPNQSDDAMLAWAGQAAVAAFSYNFVNYREELQASSGFFTADGWRLFLQALEESNNLDAVQAKKLIVSAAAISPPTILRKGLVNDRFTWRVQIPILVTYQSVTEYTQQANMVSMLVTRVSTLNSPRGIGISQFVVSPLSS